MDFYQRAKRYSIEKFTTTAFSLLANTSKENLIRLTYLAEKIPQKGFPTCHDDQMDAHLLAFSDQTIHHLKRKILFGRISGCITPVAMEIASHGRANQHCIRWIEPFFCLKSFSTVGADQKLVDDEV